MKKVLSFLLVIVCVLLTVPVAFADTDSGAYKPKPSSSEVHWSYDEDTKTLTFSGEIIVTGDASGSGYYGADGKFIPLKWYFEPPWYKYHEEAETIIVEEGIKEIEQKAFWNFSALKYISLPTTLASIDEMVFYACPKLTLVTNDVSKKMQEGVLYLPSSVVKVRDCIGINPQIQVESLPQNLSYIEESFYGTAFWLNEGNWEDGVLYCGNCLIAASEEVNGTYEIKDGTHIVASDAFRDNKNIEEVVIPKSVDFIGDDAFRDCEKLKKVTIYNYRMSTGPISLSGNSTSHWSEGVFPKETTIYCYKYSWAHECCSSFGRPVVHMGWSPDATLFEKMEYFILDILEFFGIKKFRLI